MPDLTYAQLARAVAEETKAMARSGETINAVATEITEVARETAGDAQAIAALNVDPSTVAETHELSKTMDGLEGSCRAYASAGDYAVKQAKAAQGQNQSSHRAIGQAAARSPVGRAIYDVDREWLRQD